MVTPWCCGRIANWCIWAISSLKTGLPFIDLDHGGSVIGYRDNVAAVLELIDQDTLVIPGHGELANKADLGPAGAFERKPTVLNPVAPS